MQKQAYRGHCRCAEPAAVGIAFFYYSNYNLQMNTLSQKIYIVVPAYNEASVISDVIKEIQAAGYRNIIVVDDGSGDNTYEKISRNDGVIPLKHFLNRGKGAAAKTGIEAAKMLGADVVITIDADGQHNPNDIEKMLEMIRQEYDVVLGSRLKNPAGMPKYKILHNHIGNLCVWALYGLWVTDSQSGFRAYSQKAISAIETKTDRYEYDSEVIREIYRNNLKFIEIPIEVRYTDYSMSKVHKMNLKNGLKTLIKMMISA
ncbi:MAG: glycosyl transferase family protein [uncultured bacterium]|nr:MAG: glycosyl transferase family protein [uncultured bacterium]